MTGSKCYLELVETQERAVIDARRRKTPEVFSSRAFTRVRLDAP
jgi:hypothetical protein